MSYEKGFAEQNVLNLIAFVDWMLTLPPNLAAEFKLEIQQLEAGRRMKYVTSFERSARLEEALLLVTRLLNRRLGNIDDTLLDQRICMMTGEGNLSTMEGAFTLGDNAPYIYLGK